MQLSLSSSAMDEDDDRSLTGGYLQETKEEEIQIVVEIFVSCSSTLCFTLCVMPSKTIYSLKRTVSLRVLEYQHSDSCAVYSVEYQSFFLGKQLLEDHLSLDECHISNKGRISVYSCRPFSINVAMTVCPESGPVLSTIKVNSFESVGSLKNKIFEWKGIPSDKQLLCCGDRWLLPKDDEAPLMDLGFVPQIGSDHKLLDMPLIHVTGYRHVRLSNQKYQIHVEIPHDKLQFCFTVDPSDTVSHLQAMILGKCYFCDKTHMLIFSDKNILEDGRVALHDFGIDKGARLVLCQKGPFVISVTRKGSDQRFTIEVESLDTVDFIKTKIQNITDIAPENQKLFHERDGHSHLMYNGCLARYGILKVSDSEVPEYLISCFEIRDPLNVYHSQSYRLKEISVPTIPLSFWKKLSDSALAGVPLEEFLLQVDGQSNLEDSFKICVLVPLSGCLTFRMMFTLGIGDTLESLKAKIKEQAKSCKEIDDLSYIQQGDYVLLLNKYKLPDDGSFTVKQCGIVDDSEITLCPKASFTILVCWRNDIQQDVIVNCLDTVECVKKKISARSGFHAAMELCYNEAPLSDERFLIDYGLVYHPVASMGRRWKHPALKLKVITDEERITSLHDPSGVGFSQINNQEDDEARYHGKVWRNVRFRRSVSPY